MARSRRTVEHFASRAGLDPADALEILRESGVKVERAKDVVRKNQVLKAELALGIATPKPKKIELGPPKEPTEGPRELAESLEPPPRKLRKKHQVPPLRVVGREQPLSYLTFDDAESIHWQLVRDFSGSRDPVDPPGIKSPDLLQALLQFLWVDRRGESAVFRGF